MKNKYKIRFAHTDAPECKQPFGTKAKRNLSDKIFGKEVRVVWFKKGKYGRVIGDVYLGKRYINGEILIEGFAWHAKKSSNSKIMAKLEQQAKKAKHGLWADKTPTPPWEFRSQK